MSDRLDVNVPGCTDGTCGNCQPALRRVSVKICEPCLDGQPSECHTPGCVFWMCPSVTEEQAARLKDAAWADVAGEAGPW